MFKSSAIQDQATRDAVKTIESSLDAIRRVKPAVYIQNSPTKDDYNTLVDKINEITHSLKRQS